MRGERLLFLLGSFFIFGNLIARGFSERFSLFWLSLSGAIISLLIIIILGLLLLLKQRIVLLSVSLFFCIGISGVISHIYFNGNFDKYAKPLTTSIFKESREKFEFRLTQIIPSEESDLFSILKALTIGERDGISKELKESYRKSGTSHLLALSGLHVGIIYSILTILLSILGSSTFSKIFRSITIILLLWFYALFTGLSPSIWRAVLMTTFYEIGRLFCRPQCGLNALGISAIIIGIIDPYSPSTVSFQLSFAAMLGIITIFPKMNNLLQIKSPPKWYHKPIIYIWAIASISISCQLFTLPLSLFYFGNITPFFLLSNILSMPLTSLLMPTIFVSVLTCNIPLIGELSSNLLSICIYVLNRIMVIISQLQ